MKTSRIKVPAQFMRLQKEWKSMILWLFLPVLLTSLVMKTVGVWQEETKVPIALVVEEKTKLAKQFVDEIANIELLDIHFMALPEAMHKLEQHELDSVFVIKKDYEQSVLSNKRNQLIQAYSSNQSYAYPAVVEAITSRAQEDVARSKAAFVIKQLFVDYGIESNWNYEEIIEKSSNRQQSEALIQTSFTYNNQLEQSTDPTISIVQVWGIWSLFAIITTFFIFDWVLKENRRSMRSRWLFTAISFRKYALGQLFLYTAILFAMDVFTVFIFLYLFKESVTIKIILSLFFFRLIINLFVFLLAGVYRQLFMYYVSGIAVALFLILLGGAIIPLGGVMQKWPWIEALSPVQSLLSGTFPIGWLLVLSIWLTLWVWKEGKSIA